MAFLLALALAFAAIPVAASEATGILPGVFTYKLHSTVPLRTVKEEFPPFQRSPDARGLFTAPFTTQAGERVDMSVLSALEVGGIDTVLDGSEVPQDVVTELPPGPILNLDEIPPCTQAEFINTVAKSAGGCPAASQVGVMGVLFGGTLPNRAYPLYKLVAGHNHLATFGFPYELLGLQVGVLLDADLRAEGDYGITLSSTQISLPKFVPAPFMTIWGVPAAAVHDAERWNPETRKWGESLDSPAVPLVASPTDCDVGVEEARARLRYWSAPDRWLPEDPEDPAYRAFAPAPDGCDGLVFEPRAELAPSGGEAGSPTGIDLSVQLPRGSDHLETPPLSSAILTLPQGMAVNPSTADGLMGCAPEQIGLLEEGFSGSEQVRFDDGAVRCPAGAKIGDATVEMPIAEGPIAGDVYLATPLRNPFHSLLALYLVLDGPGFTAKLPIRVDVEPGGGRLRASLESLPPLPLDSVRLNLFAGPRAPLVSPPGCEAGAIELLLAPSSSPQSGPPAQLVRPFTYSSGQGGGGCGGTGAAPGGQQLRVGLRDTAANGSSPLVLDLRGGEIGGLEVGLPPGLALRVRGVARCGEEGVERARSREEPGGGAIERSEPSCPLDSRVGSLLTGVGSGAAQLLVRGDVYLAGPYEGAPLSLVAITPALAGGTEADPLFDLGTAVDRVALEVDRRTGAISARGGAPPRALGGIPLRLWSMRLILDRPGFVRAPSGCGSKEVSVEVEGGTGARTALRGGFRSSGCDRLAFAPRLSLRALRGLREGQHPSVRVVLRAKAAEAGIAGARILLGPAELLDRRRLRTGCHASPLNGCPADSIRGRVSAWSELLGRRLDGRVYLRSSSAGSPELVLAFAGPPEMEVVGGLRLAGGRVRVDFPSLPDVGLTRLALTLSGGRRSFLTNARALCGGRAEYATARLVSQAGTVRLRKTSLGGRCGSASGPPVRRGQMANRRRG